MFNSKFDLTGKTALITGAAGLLGKKHAIALLESGCRVIMTDLSENSLNEASNSIKKKFNNTDIIPLQMDVTDLSSIKSCQNILLSKNIYTDILINNAAIDPKVSNDNNIENSSRFENFPINEWEKQINVGLTGAFQCSKIFGSKMVERNSGGVILNIASDLSIIAPDQRIYKKKGLKDAQQPVKPVTYSVIKTGLVGLTKYIATYWGDKNIRCNALSPGGVFNNQDKEFVSSLTDLIPLKRMANVDEYKSAIQFLCSDASSYMTGFNLVIDGGRHVW